MATTYTRLVVELPPTLHTALKQEATRRSISLRELAIEMFVNALATGGKTA
jgi:hypothetical protein